MSLKIVPYCDIKIRVSTVDAVTAMTSEDGIGEIAEMAQEGNIAVYISAHVSDGGSA